LSTTGRIGAAQEDERACERRIRVEGEVPRKGGLLAAPGVARTMGGNIPVRMLLQVSLAAAMDALPEFALPEAVEALDGVLKPRFARLGKDGDDAQRQAQAADAPNGVGELMRALEDGVVSNWGRRAGRRAASARAGNRPWISRCGAPAPRHQLIHHAERSQ